MHEGRKEEEMRGEEGKGVSLTHWRRGSCWRNKVTLILSEWNWFMTSIMLGNRSYFQSSYLLPPLASCMISIWSVTLVACCASSFRNWGVGGLVMSR